MANYKRKYKRKYNQGGDLGTTLGSTLGGAAGQALIPIPGVGFALGSALGGLAGGAIGNQFGDNQKPKPPNQMVIPEQFQYNQSAGMNPAGNSFGYALGGDLTQYKGNSHEQGGIPLGQTDTEVEGNEVRIGNYVFSDRLTVPKQKLSFAEMATSINKKYSNSKGDIISTETMNRELAQLAQVQEGEKQKIEVAQSQQQGIPQEQVQQKIQQENNIQPEQLAQGGEVGDDGEPWRLGDIFKGRQYAARADHPALKTNEYYENNPEYIPAKDNWFNNQFNKSGISIYSGNPYSSIKFGVKIPIAGGKHQTVKPKASINPAYLYTPKGKEGTFYGDHIGNQYIPNLRFWGDNNVGKHIWGDSPTQSNYNFTGMPVQSNDINPKMPHYSNLYPDVIKPNTDKVTQQKALGGSLIKKPERWKRYAAGGELGDPPKTNNSKPMYEEIGVFLNNADDNFKNDPTYKNLSNAYQNSINNPNAPQGIYDAMIQGYEQAKTIKQIYDNQSRVQEYAFGGSLIKKPMPNRGRQTNSKKKKKWSGGGIPPYNGYNTGIDLSKKPYMNKIRWSGGVVDKKIPPNIDVTGRTQSSNWEEVDGYAIPDGTFATENELNNRSDDWFFATADRDDGDTQNKDENFLNYMRTLPDARNMSDNEISLHFGDKKWGKFHDYALEYDGNVKPWDSNLNELSNNGLPVTTNLTKNQTLSNQTPIVATPNPNQPFDEQQIGSVYINGSTGNKTLSNNLNTSYNTNPTGLGVPPARPAQSVTDTSITNQQASKLDNFKTWLSDTGIDLKNLSESAFDKLKTQFSEISGEPLDINMSDLSKTAASTLGGIYDIARGMQGGQYESYGRLNPVNLQRLDPSKNIQQQREIGATGMNKIKNIGGQGLGQYLNNANAVTSNTQQNVANTISQYDNANKGIQNQQIAQNQQIQAQNLQMDMTQNDINAKERDMASNNIQKGLTTVSQGLNQQFQDQSQRQVQDQVITNLLSTKNYQYTKDNQGNYIMTTERGNFKIDAKGNVYDDKGKVIGDVNTFDFGTQNNGTLANNYNSNTMGPLPQS